MSDDASHSAEDDPDRPWIGMVVHLVVLSGLWAVLVDGQIAESWYFGVPTVLMAAAVGQHLKQFDRPRIEFAALIGFVPYFTRRSIEGGIDVALRALRPSRPIRPALVRHDSQLDEEGLAIVVFVAVISLLPGTLSAHLDGSAIVVHVVDGSWPLEEQLDELESRIDRIFPE